MLDREAIEQLQESEAISAANGHANSPDRGIVALPEKFKIHDLEAYLPNRRRARGTMTTVSDTDFAAYVKAHKEEGAAVFVNEKDMTATAILNLGTPEKPGHTDNRAVLAPPKTAAYSALLSIANGRGQPQKAIAEFLEDWSDIIRCQGATEAIPVPKAVAAMRKLTIEELRKQNSEEQNLSAHRSVFETITASSSEPIPATVTFACVPHVGMQSREFVMRLGILTGEANPMPVLRIIKKEVHDEQMAQELSERIRSALTGEGVTVAVGSYTSK
jgi:uncharacterized protein YfdQ (DUF2303 family)